ncbi:hypothetical protein [Serratia fonticola]|uniref:hypothetical protein n=1 Tax=Serratia fonticola TaxID=47917 RepID=UPI0034C656B9
MSTSIITSFWAANKKILKSAQFLSQDSREGGGFLKKKSTKIFLPLLLLAPGVAQITPLLFLFNQLEFSKDGSTIAQASSIAVLALMFSMLSILPGIIYINENKNGKILRSIILTLIFTPATLAILSIFFLPIPHMIINMTMNLSGISDWREHQFYIDDKTQPHTMFNGLEWDTRYYQGIPNRFFITGVNIFTFGDIKLVCPTKIINARKKSLKMTPNDINGYDRKKSQLKSVAMECIPLNKNDITAWDSPISDPIYYEKVKVTSDSSMLKMLHSLK